MGGTSDGYGNVTPVSEYNIWADPEGAEIVFASDMPKTMVGWDISRKYAVISDDDAESIRAIGTEAATVAVDAQVIVRKFCSGTSGVDGFDFPDPIATAVAISEQMILASKQAAVTIVTNEGPTRGMAIVDDRQFSDRACSTRVVLEADRDHFLALLRSALA